MKGQSLLSCASRCVAALQEAASGEGRTPVWKP